MFGRQYYQQAAPMGTWGTNQYQMGRPPPVSFQPQPNWSGLDYFNAHAYNADPNVYNQAYASLNNYSNSNMGASRDTAKRWHRRIYASDPNQYDFMPEDLGYAAAYEAYRTWKYNSSLSQPLSGDRERQREGLVGLAIAEATRLMNTTYFAGDPYKRSQACNAAAATAAELFRHYDNRTSEYGGDYGGRSYSRPASRVGSDTGSDYMRGGRSRSRSRYRSGRSRSREGYGSYGTPYGQGAMPIPGVAGSGYSAGSYDSPYADQYGQQYPMASSPYGPGPGSYPNAPFPTSIPIGTGGIPYAGSNSMAMIPPQQSRHRSRSFSGSAYGGSAYGGPTYGGNYAGSNYGTPYTGSQPMTGYYPQQPAPHVYSTSGYDQRVVHQQPGQTIVIHRGHKDKHRGRSRHRSRSRSRSRSRHHHHRSRSSEPKYIGY